MNHFLQRLSFIFLSVIFISFNLQVFFIKEDLSIILTYKRWKEDEINNLFQKIDEKLMDLYLKKKRRFPKNIKIFYLFKEIETLIKQILIIYFKTSNDYLFPREYDRLHKSFDFFGTRVSNYRLKHVVIDDLEIALKIIIDTLVFCFKKPLKLIERCFRCNERLSGYRSHMFAVHATCHPFPRSP